MRDFKKTAALIALLGASSVAQAEIIGLEVGIAGWQAAPSGWIQDEDAGPQADLEDQLLLDDETGGFAWVRVMHPIPLLPNVKVTYTPLQFEGAGTSNFDFAGASFSGEVESEAQLDQLDVALFYEVLDNWVDLDVGLNVKVLDAYVRATELTTGDTEEVDFTAPIPMLYANVGFTVPFTDITASVEATGVGFDGNALTDIKASLRYTVLGVIALEAGYRSLKLELDDIEDVSADLTVDGPYIGVAARF